MTVKIHELGDTRALTFRTTLDGSPVDPDDLTVRIREPNGALTSYVKDVDAELEAVATGEWRVLWLCRQAGMHRFRFEAGGNLVQVGEGAFFVARSTVLEPADALPA